jgi:histidine triad (HIT) family protein
VVAAVLGALRCGRVTSCERVGTVIAGWDVPHFHYHLIPMFAYHDLDPTRARQFSAEENARVRDQIDTALRRME